MLEVTLVSLQSMVDSFGSDSAEVKAAKAAIKTLIAWVQEQLDTVFKGDVTYQVKHVTT